MHEHAFGVRRAEPTDAERIIEILEDVASERVHTAITNPWSAAEQERYIARLSGREGVFVAEDSDKVVIGYQVLELWAATLDSMSHVGQIGTFIHRSWRGRGVGSALFRVTRNFALANGYAKFVIQVRGQNSAGQAFYSRLGFRECGRLTRQVRAHDMEDDEILMELFL